MLLKDPIVERWVLIAPGRDQRPGARRPPRRSTGAATCPFCPGREAETPPEIAADRDGAPDAPGWRVRVIPNKYPAAAGAHEVVVESPRHDDDLATLSAADLRRVLDMYVARMRALSARDGVRYVQLFRNAGEAAGATQSHPHAQLLALPVVPPIVREEMRGAAAVHAQRGGCVFCELAAVAGTSDHLVLETASHVAFAPPAPRMPFETWVLPRAHAATFGEAVDTADLARCLGDLLRSVARALGDPAYNLFLHHAPSGGENDPSYHWHLELLPRTSGIAGFELATSVHVNAVGPSDAARALREATPPRA